MPRVRLRRQRREPIAKQLRPYFFQLNTSALFSAEIFVVDGIPSTRVVFHQFGFFQMVTFNRVSKD
jgi:hypothetical protein